MNVIGSETWQEYRAALVRFVLQRVPDQAAAEDIVQEVLIKAWTRQDTLKDTARLRPWLYQITRNAIIDHFRAQKPSEPVPAALVVDDADADTDNAQQELARCMIPLLNALPDPYRQALRLTEFDGLTQREAAVHMGLTVAGAKTRVHRARSLLRDELLRCCRVELDRRGVVVDFEQNDNAGGCTPTACAPPLVQLNQAQSVASASERNSAR